MRTILQGIEIKVLRVEFLTRESVMSRHATVWTCTVLLRLGWVRWRMQRNEVETTMVLRMQKTDGLDLSCERGACVRQIRLWTLGWITF